MNSKFEEQLRDALRPVDPDAGFAERVLERIAKEPPQLQPRRFPRKFKWLAAALAASVLAGVIGVHEWQVQREREGLEARKQLIEALRVTGEQLDRVYQAVNRESPQAPNDRSGV